MDRIRDFTAFSNNHNSIALVKLAVTYHLIRILEANGINMTLDLHNDRHNSSVFAIGCHQKVWMRCFSNILLLFDLPLFYKIFIKDFDVASLSDCALLVRVDIIIAIIKDLTQNLACLLL